MTRYLPAYFAYRALSRNSKLCSFTWNFSFFFDGSRKTRHSRMRVLCVAEKPSISRAVADHLSGGNKQTVRSVRLGHLGCIADLFEQHNTRNNYIKNYSFTFDFGGNWGHCDVTMTCVTGHLTSTQFPDDFKDWKYPPPGRLFSAPVITKVDEVCSSHWVDLSSCRDRRHTKSQL